MQHISVLSGTILGDAELVSLTQVSRACCVQESWIVEFLAEGVVEPIEQGPDGPRFDSLGVQRLRVASRLRQDLGVNTAGVALALELMDELAALRRQLEHTQYPGNRNIKSVI